jgi:serine/threonine protein kinase
MINATNWYEKFIPADYLFLEEISEERNLKAVVVIRHRINNKKFLAKIVSDSGSELAESFASEFSNIKDLNLKLVQKNVYLPTPIINSKNCFIYKYEDNFNAYSTNEISLSMDKVLHIARAILTQLVFIHSKNYVHGDITDSNILLHKTRQDDAILIDYGESICLNAITKKNKKRRGTKNYTAPEFDNKKNPTKEEDVFAIGKYLGYLHHEDIDGESNIIERFEKLYKSMTDTDPIKRPTAEKALQQAHKIYYKSRELPSGDKNNISLQNLMMGFVSILVIIASLSAILPDNAKKNAPIKISPSKMKIADVKFKMPAPKNNSEKVVLTKIPKQNKAKAKGAQKDQKGSQKSISSKLIKNNIVKIYSAAKNDPNEEHSRTESKKPTISLEHDEMKTTTKLNNYAPFINLDKYDNYQRNLDLHSKRILEEREILLNDEKEYRSIIKDEKL